MSGIFLCLVQAKAKLTGAKLLTAPDNNKALASIDFRFPDKEIIKVCSSQTAPNPLKTVPIDALLPRNYATFQSHYLQTLS